MSIKIIKPKIPEPHIDVIIQIRSEEDLCLLWHLFNQSDHGINQKLRKRADGNPLKYDCSKQFDWWSEIDKVVEEYGLKTKQLNKS